MADAAAPRIAILPKGADWIDAAVIDGGAVVVQPHEATAAVWTASDQPEGLRDLLRDHPHLDWVQLPWAGIEPYLEVLDAGRRWTCGKGVYAEPVAEHALALLLAGFRRLGAYARRTAWDQQLPANNLYDAKITILGGGGIAQDLISLLRPFRVRITVVRRSSAPMEDVEAVLPMAELDRALEGADAVVLALALTPETEGILGARELALLGPDTWVINIARGGHLDTDALADALAAGRLGGAGLDVTDPEPLPDDHRLWTMDNVIITPHTGNTREMAKPLLGARITENVRRYGAGEPLIGTVDLTAGY